MVTSCPPSVSSEAMKVPDPDLVTQEGDVVYMTVGADRLADLDAHLGGPTTGGHS